MPHELSPEQLRRTFDPHALGIETTEHIEPLEGIIGQRRAVSALQFGLGFKSWASISTSRGRRASAR
jgi:hypothetical protein